MNPLPNLIPEYAAVNIPKARAIALIVRGRLNARNARGKGNRAARRMP